MEGTVEGVVVDEDDTKILLHLMMQANPKGSLKIAENHESGLYMYSWMDSSVVYFIDSMYGPGCTATISRRQGADHVLFVVPKLIVMYNKYMHAVDVFDQVRKYFGVDYPMRRRNTLFACSKYCSAWD